MKKRAIVRELAAVRQQLAALRTALDAITASQGEIDLPALHTAVGWLHERVDMVATKLSNMRGDPALDGAAVKRLAFAVAQFSARLDRLEAPPPPKARPKRKPPRTAK